VVWSALGAGALYAIDHSLVGGLAWLVAGAAIGCLGKVFLGRLVEVIPHNGDRLPADPFVLAPVAGLTYGLLLGSLFGLAAGSGPGGRGWQSALLGAATGPPAFSLLLLALFSLLPCAWAAPVTWPQRTHIALLCLCLPLVALVVLTRCLLWVPRHRRRLQAHRWAVGLGGAFGADPARGVFYGVNFAGTAVRDEDLGRLRVFPELAYLGLAGTAVTDEGLGHLRGLPGLRYLDLRGTQVKEGGCRALSQALPRTTVSR
jgi:hypothetical protein